MATTMMDAATEQIFLEAQAVRFTRVLATAIAGIFFGIGWITGRAWLGTVFCVLAVRYGFREGTGRRAGSSPPTVPHRAVLLSLL